VLALTGVTDPGPAVKNSLDRYPAGSILTPIPGAWQLLARGLSHSTLVWDIPPPQKKAAEYANSYLGQGGCAISH